MAIPGRPSHVCTSIWIVSLAAWLLFWAASSWSSSTHLRLAYPHSRCSGPVRERAGWGPLGELLPSPAWNVSESRLFCLTCWKAMARVDNTGLGGPKVHRVLLMVTPAVRWGVATSHAGRSQHVTPLRHAVGSPGHEGRLNGK